MVALAAGSLLGGAMFRMLPSAVSRMPESLAPYLWLVAGLFTFPTAIGRCPSTGRSDG